MQASINFTRLKSQTDEDKTGFLVDGIMIVPSMAFYRRLRQCDNPLGFTSKLDSPRGGSVGGAISGS